MCFRTNFIFTELIGLLNKENNENTLSTMIESIRALVDMANFLTQCYCDVACSRQWRSLLPINRRAEWKNSGGTWTSRPVGNCFLVLKFFPFCMPQIYAA